MSQFADGDAGFQHRHVGGDVVAGVVHGGNHRVGGALVAHPPGAADVDADAVCPDQIGIKGHDFIVLDQTRAAFLKPRVGAGAGCQQPGLDPFAAAFDVALVQFGPDVIFGHSAQGNAGAGLMLHLGYRGFAGVVGAFHGQNFVRPLDGAGAFGHLFPLHHVKARAFQRAQAVDHDLVNGKTAVAAGMGAHHLVHLRRKAAGVIGDLVTADVVKERRTRAQFLDQRVEGHKKRRVLVFPHHHMPVGADQAGAERIVAVPQLHVGGVGGVADVQGVEHHDAAVIARDQRLHHPVPAEFAHAGQVGQGQACRFPFAKGKLGGADFDTVIVVRGAIAKGGPPAGVDLAAVGVVLVHGRPP